MRNQQLIKNMYAQLGGKTFISMTGAKLNYLTGRDLEGVPCDVVLIISLPKSVFNIHKIKIVEMCLMADDTYTFKFIKANSNKPFKVIEKVYFDEVQDLFERETNLLVTLYNREGSSIVIGQDVI